MSWILSCWLLFFANDGLVVKTERPNDAKRLSIFVEDMRFGVENEEGDGDYFLWTGADPTVAGAPDGSIYVGDVGGKRLLKFDAQGRFVKLVAGEGQGPGEFQELRDVKVLDDGRVVALDALFDMGRLFWYDANGSFQRIHTPSIHLMNMTCSPAGDLFAAATIAMEERRTIRLSQDIFDGDMKQVMRQSSNTMSSFDGSKAEDRQYMIDRTADIFRIDFGSKGVATFDGSGRAYTAMSGTYEITRWNQGMTAKEKVFKVSYKPEMRTEQEIESLIEDRHTELISRFPSGLGAFSKSAVAKSFEQANLPPTKRPIKALLAFGKGYVLVVRDAGVGGIDTADLFDPNGSFLGEVSMDHYAFTGTNNAPRMSFRGEYAYTIETNGEGEHEVVRYKIKLP